MSFVLMRNQHGSEFAIRPLWVADIEPVFGVESFDADLNPVPMCIVSFIGGAEKIVRGSLEQVMGALTPKQEPAPMRRMRSVGEQ